MNPVAWGRTRKSPEDEENRHVIIHDRKILMGSLYRNDM